MRLKKKLGKSDLREYHRWTKYYCTSSPRLTKDKIERQNLKVESFKILHRSRLTGKQERQRSLTKARRHAGTVEDKLLNWCAGTAPSQSLWVMPCDEFDLLDY